VPIEIIKEVEVEKSIDMDELMKMVAGMQQVEVSRTTLETNKKPTSKAKTQPKPTVKAAPKKVKKDDLTKIEGIGPAINRLLNADGITTFLELSKAKVSRLERILTDGGPRFRMHKPGTWPQQSGLAAKGKWEELNALQDKLDGGK